MVSGESISSDARFVDVVVGALDGFGPQYAMVAIVAVSESVRSRVATADNLWFGWWMFCYTPSTTIVILKFLLILMISRSVVTGRYSYPENITPVSIR